MDNNIVLTNALINNEVEEWYKLSDDEREEDIKKTPEYNPDDKAGREVEINEWKEDQEPVNNSQPF